MDGGYLFLALVYRCVAFIGDGMNEESYANNVFDECEIHENCTVEIWKNSKTGKISIGWYENKDERKND